MNDQACDVKAGGWYLCGVCHTCQEPIPLMQVHPHGRRGNMESVVFNGVPCPNCETRHSYPLREAICLGAERRPRHRQA